MISHSNDAPDTRRRNILVGLLAGLGLLAAGYFVFFSGSTAPQVNPQTAAKADALSKEMMKNSPVDNTPVDPAKRGSNRKAVNTP